MKPIFKRVGGFLYFATKLKAADFFLFSRSVVSWFFTLEISFIF